MDNSILITWFIGVSLSSILVYIWSILYIGDTEWGMHRIPVNTIIAGLYVIFSFIPVPFKTTDFIPEPFIPTL